MAARGERAMGTVKAKKSPCVMMYEHLQQDVVSNFSFVQYPTDFQSNLDTGHHCDTDNHCEKTGKRRLL